MPHSDDTIAIINAIKEEAEKTQNKFNEIESKYERIMCGFPDQDPDGHRAYHQVVIERQKLRNEIMRGAAIRMGQGGIFAFLAAMAWLAWELFKKEIQK
ncbi:MAG: hypothetical protein WCY72_08890 [Lysobacteraceae bacterium]|jgi:hypothetical protein